jgi:hypothetical protein
VNHDSSSADRRAQAASILRANATRPKTGTPPGTRIALKKLDFTRTGRDLLEAQTEKSARRDKQDQVKSALASLGTTEPE